MSTAISRTRVRPIDVTRLVELGCDVVALGHRARSAFAQIGRADAHHDRAMTNGAHLTARWGARAAANGCGCDTGFVAIGRQIARARAADVVEDAWIYGRLAELLDRVWQLGRTIDAGIERAAKALRGGAR